MSRIVMIHGICPGIGQSTLTARLARAIADVDVLWEDQLSQPAIFTRPEFAAVADRFRRHNAEPTKGIGHPPPELLEEAYRRLVHTVLENGRTTLLGWSFLDLSEDLDWARADEEALADHVVAVRQVLEPTRPVLVSLVGDVAQAVDRALAQRGREWFSLAVETRWARRTGPRFTDDASRSTPRRPARSPVPWRREVGRRR